jgi:hypothetical protein
MTGRNSVHLPAGFGTLRPATTPLISGASSPSTADTAELLAQATRVRFTAGQALIREGEEAGTVYAVTSGRVRIAQGSTVVATAPRRSWSAMSVLSGSGRTRR